MTVETVWVISAAIIGVVLWYWFQIPGLIGLIIGAFIGLVITTTMKMFNWKFNKSADYSSSSRSSSFNDWDD